MEKTFDSKQSHGLRCILDTQIIAHKALRNTSDQIIRLTFTWLVIELPERIKHIISFHSSTIWYIRYGFKSVCL